MNKFPESKTLRVNGAKVGLFGSAALVAAGALASPAEALTDNDIKTNPSMVYGAMIDAVDKLPAKEVKNGQTIRQTGSFKSLDGDTITFSYSHRAGEYGANTSGIFKAEEFGEDGFQSSIILVGDGTKVHIVTVRATAEGNSIITNIDGDESLMPTKKREEFTNILSDYLDAAQSYNK